MVTTYGVYVHILQPQIQTFLILMIYVKILGENLIINDIKVCKYKN